MARFVLPHRWIKDPDESLDAGFVQDNFEAVEQGVEQALTPVPVVTSLPANPFDGMAVDYVADSTNGVVWRFRYRTAASGSYKWEFVGGSGLYTAVAAGGGPTSITAATWSNAPTTQCDVTLPLAGDYEIRAKSIVAPAAAAGFLLFGVAVGVGGSPAALLQSGTSVAAGEYATGTIVGVTTGRSAGDVLRFRYYNSATGNIAVVGTTILATPIRVG